MGCGESKHVATENTISKKNSRAGSRRGNKTPETVEATSGLDRNARSLMKGEGKSVNQDTGADNSRAVADGNGIGESTEYEEMGCGSGSKHFATGNAISRKNSRAGSRRGGTPETIEATSKLDRNTSSLKKGERNGANNSRVVVANGNGIVKSMEYAEMGCGGESKHVATGNVISRKNSRAGSNRGKTIEETSKLDRSSSSLMKKEGKSDNDQDSGADNSRVVADGNGIAEGTKYAEMGCGEPKHVVTGNTISRKNSRAGSKRGKTPEIIEETSKLDTNTTSSMKEEGKSVSAVADHSRTVDNGNDIAESTEYAELGCDEQKTVASGNTISRKNSIAESKKGNKTPETIEETRKLDRNTSLLMKEEGKSVNDQDSAGADNSRTVANGNGIAENTEYAEMGHDEQKHVMTGNTISLKNSIAESKKGSKTPETIEETKELDRNTSSLMNEEGKSANDQDSGANNPEVVDDGNNKAESTELKKQESVENDNKEKQNGVPKENEEPTDDLAFEAISGSSGKESLSNDNLKVADALEDKKLAEEITTKEETKEDAKEETVKDQKLAEEKKEEIAYGETETVKEENSVKETETAETTEDKVSTPVMKEEETPAGSPVKDQKTE